MSFKPIDPKRDEIRRYLERGSVLDSLTKVFIRVIKERPENPMEYIRNNIGIVRHQHDKYERLAQDLQEANEEIQRLRAIINSINPDVLQTPHIPIDSEPTAVAEKVMDDATAAEGEVSQNTNGGDKATSSNPDELVAADENCHIEEEEPNKAVVSAEVTKSVQDSSTQSTTVQAEPSTE
ncbi:c-Myc-binding protein homolog [Drosophila albomicans]|uniref:c-Myc-binding protein homolog n=1 Tax=Drosophila albomicans TaxID=7291 RepID=A0A6P8XSW4_DROAB|nr:c-Myc-binding protein homolog [Drosophila albomicans]